MRFAGACSRAWRPEALGLYLLTAAVVTPPALAAEPPAVRGVPDRPKVVRVEPANGAMNVEPVTELHIAFDQPMDPTSATLDWKPLGDAGYRLRGALRYVPETREFVLPVYLKTGRKHEVTVNRASPFREGDYDGFQSTGGVAAREYHWSFQTADAAAGRKGAGEAPRVVTLSPRSDSEVALLTPLEVAFDRAMDPDAYGLEAVDPGPNELDRIPTLDGPIDYDGPARRFTLWLKLPANWNGALRLTGFRSADGAAAEPVELKYRTLHEPFAASLRQRIEQAGRAPSPALRALVERVRARRRGLRSLSERTLTTTNGRLFPDWYHRYEVRGADFAMQGGRQFVGNIDGIMGIPFRVGRDGEACWFLARNDLVQLPSNQVDDQQTRFCDPFDADGPRDADGVIRDLKLKYRREAVVRGRRCHLVRSYDMRVLSHGYITPMIQWAIDAESLMPLRVEAGNHLAIDFTDLHIDAPIPDATFRPAAGPEIKQADARPLANGYTRRFLRVDDGTNGRMSVRWGMSGPAGTNSSGLN